MNWYTKVTQNLALLPDFILHYENLLDTARFDCGIKGNVERNLAALPGVTEQHFARIQEIEAVLNFLNIELKKIRSKTFKKYLENYQRALTSRDAERYVDSEQDVVDMETLVNEVALLRNKWLAVMKGLDQKSFMLGHIVRIRVAGMEDLSL